MGNLTYIHRQIMKNISKTTTQKNDYSWRTIKFRYFKLLNTFQNWSFHKCWKNSNMKNFPISTNLETLTVLHHKLSVHSNNFQIYTLLKCCHFWNSNLSTKTRHTNLNILKFVMPSKPSHATTVKRIRI